MFTNKNKQIIIKVTNPSSLVWGSVAKEKIKVLIDNALKTKDDYIVYNHYTFKVADLKRFLYRLDIPR